MSPREFLEIADELASGTREAEWRSAVSRAYYAAFHQARNVLRDFGFAVPHADQAHGYLWLRLANAAQADIRRAGADLNSLRSMRNRADYDWDEAFTHATAVGQVELADHIVGILEMLPTVPHLAANVIEAIKAYERDVLRQATWSG